MFTIGARRIGQPEPVYIVAELGVNHDGDPRVARELLCRAKEAGADAAKLQLFVPAELTAPDAPLCDYQAGGRARTQRALLEGLVLPPDAVHALCEEARRIDITLFASVFDAPSLRRALELRLPVIKLGSGELTSLPLHEEICQARAPTICSVGMAGIDDIRPVVEFYRRHETPLMLLHCVSSYPAPEAQLNLRAIRFLHRELACTVGFSDHALGSRAATLAVACGAALLEKHFTLDRTRPGPDHKASLDPAQFALYVKTVRETEVVLGAEEKRIAPAEREVRDKVRKSIVLRAALKAGTPLARDALAYRRPGTGISPMALPSVLGLRLRSDCPAGHRLRWEDLAP
jgi:N,N'-diacetyllegionaminate synthase